jgi:hypothetical protein
LARVWLRQTHRLGGLEDAFWRTLWDPRGAGCPYGSHRDKWVAPEAESKLVYFRPQGLPILSLSDLHLVRMLHLNL